MKEEGRCIINGPDTWGRRTYPGDPQGNGLQRNARDSRIVTEYIRHAHRGQKLLQLALPR